MDQLPASMAALFRLKRAMTTGAAGASGPALRAFRLGKASSLRLLRVH
jgi:hypothetical protein